MNQYHIFIATFLLLLTANGSLVSQTETPIRRIQVTGTTTMTLAPNELEMNIRIRHENKDGSDAVADYRKTRGQIIDTLKKYGVPDSTISESGMQFGTFIKRLNYNSDGEELFYAQSSFSASVFDFENYPNLAVALTTIPGTSLERSTYTNDSIIQLRHKARLEAVKEARKKAEAIAAVYGATVGAPLLIQENSSNPSSPWISGGYSNGVIRGGRGEEGSFDTGLMVADDYLSVTASIYVEFELVD